MAFDFKKAFNSQVKVANKLNQGLNKIIGNIGVQGVQTR